MVARKYHFLVVPIAIGVILPAIFVPWISFNLFGYDSYTPLQVTAILAGSGNPGSSLEAEESLRSVIGSYGNVYASGASMALFFSAVAGLFLSVIWPYKRSRISLLAGALAISSSLLWIYSTESLKSNFAEIASVTGGVIGEEFKGQERTLADIFFVIGVGHYLVLAGGTLAITGSVLSPRNERTGRESERVGTVQKENLGA